MGKWAEVVENIKDYLTENPTDFEQIAEELDNIDGFLGDDRYYAMEELDDVYEGEAPTEVLRRAFFGYDEDTYTTDAHGERNYGEFNPNRDYFHFNGYGNLVSTDYKDYSSYLDEDFIRAMIEHRDALNLDFELENLLDEAEEADAD